MRRCRSARSAFPSPMLVADTSSLRIATELGHGPGLALADELELLCCYTAVTNALSV